MSNPPSGLQVSWHPVENDKLKHLFGHEVAGITLDLRGARPLTANEHFARARRIVERAPTDAIGRALLVYGFPRVEGAPSAQAEAVALLKAAAAIEQALMVQYLYAAFSATDGDTFDPAEILTRLAVEEMGHLLTVTNLRMILGAEPYFGRQDQNPPSGFDPYPFILERLTLASLGKYVAAEAPDPSDLTDPAERAILQRISEEAAAGIKEPVIHRVGLIYLRLFFLFQENDDPVEPWPVAAKAGGEGWGARWHLNEADILEARLARQMEGGSWKPDDGQFLGLAARNRKEARQAIFDVAAQGEGSASTAHSHFRRLFGLHQHVETTPVPIDKLSKPFPPLSSAVFDDPAGLLCRLFDIRYEILLINLQQVFLESETALRNQRKEWCLEEMTQILPRMQRLIERHPQSSGGDPALMPAAPFFRMPHDAVPEDAASLKVRMRDAIAASEKCIVDAMTAGVTNAVFGKIRTLDQNRA